MSIQIKDFGKTTAGQPVKVGILANDTIEVHILSYGATIQQLLVPDRKGNKVDVVLGYPTVQDYELNTCFLGAVVGRYANRIGGSKFTLYEEEYHVTPNEGTICQLVLENSPEDELYEVLDFCLSVGLPVCLKDLGTDSIDDALLKAVAEKTCIPDESVHNMPFPVTPDMVAAAIKTADAIGHAYKYGCEDDECGCCH